MSLTNTDPRKVQYFAKFPWPRISTPMLNFALPEAERRAEVIAKEKLAEQEIRDVLAQKAVDIAAIIIAVVSWGIMWLMSVLGITIGGGFMGAIIHLLVAAVVLMISGNIVRGLRVKGFGGALVGAVALAVVGWLVGLLLGAFMPA